MTYQDINIILLVLFLIGLTTLAATRHAVLLAVNNAAVLICVPLFGTFPFAMFGYTTNVGNLFFAIVMYGFALNHLFHGTWWAYRMISEALLAMLIVLVSMFLLQDGGVVGPWIDAHIQLGGARIVAFYLVQSLFVRWMDHPSPRPALVRIPLLMIVLNTLDGAVFFPAAFATRLPARQVISYAIIGIAARAAITVAAVPALAACLRLKHRRAICGGAPAAGDSSCHPQSRLALCGSPAARSLEMPSSDYR